MNFITKMLLIVFMCIVSNNSYAIDCIQHPIFCKVVELQPNIDRKWAMEFSNYIAKYAKRYGLDPLRSIAIANQESGIRNIDRCIKAVLFKKEEKPTHGLKEFTIETVCTDIGIFQLSINTIEEYKLDVFKLKDSVEYQVETHFKILKNKTKMCKELGEDSWTCYHSKTPSFREEYKRVVNRFY